MNKSAFFLLAVLLVPGAHVRGQVPGVEGDLIGDWACYGYEESETGMDVAEPVFMTLESDDGLFFECDRQVLD